MLLRVIYNLSKDELLKQNITFLISGWSEKVFKNGFDIKNLKMHGDLRVGGLAENPKRLKSDAGRSSVGVFAVLDCLGLIVESPRNAEIIDQARRNFVKSPHGRLYTNTQEDFADFKSKASS